MSKFTLPCIDNVITKEGLSHFVVIFKITKTHVVVGDPAKDLLRLETDEFYKNFTGALLILKPNQDFASGKIRGEKIFNRFLKLLLPQKKLFIYSILASIILTALGIVSSLFNKVIMDEILPYQVGICFDNICSYSSYPGYNWFCKAVDDDISITKDRHTFVVRLF
ncbi:MAG: hypothetical protein GX270_13455, partial [Clostridiaceae bacterium]|nr:hypothetical protein [Clostridiaceae bacterium]